MKKNQNYDLKGEKMIKRCYIQDLEKYKEKMNKKNSFRKKKENTIRSLNEVEYFLNNWRRISKGIKLYKILK